MTAPTTTFFLVNPIPVAWSATDASTGVASVDARWASTPYNGAPSAWAYPSGVQGTTQSAVSFPPPQRGATYCFAVRARDRAGNTSAWSTPRCTGVPVDDATLSATSGWQRGHATGYYAGTYTAASAANQTLTLTGVRMRHLGIVATRCPGCGKVGVYLNGTLLKTVDLQSGSTLRQQLISVADWTSLHTGTVRITTMTNGKPVAIDGLAINRY